MAETAIGEVPEPSAYRQVMDLCQADTMWLAGYLSRSAPDAVIQALKVLQDAKKRGSSS